MTTLQRKPCPRPSSASDLLKWQGAAPQRVNARGHGPDLQGGQGVTQATSSLPIAAVSPRLRRDDDDTYAAVSKDPLRAWIVSPCPPGGWSVTMIADGRKSTTHGGFKPEVVAQVLQEWGLTEPVDWSP